MDDPSNVNLIEVKRQYIASLEYHSAERYRFAKQSRNNTVWCLIFCGVTMCTALHQAWKGAALFCF